MRLTVRRIRRGRGRGSDWGFRCCRLVQAMAPPLRRVPARPVARWATLQLVAVVGNVAAGGSAGAAVATAADTPVWVGVAPADAVVSLLDGVELVCAPPELCTIPERGSAVEASLGEEVELAWPSTELCPTVEPEEEPADEADEFVAGGLMTDLRTHDEPESSDDDESDDELDELESVGSANATPGVFATAAPMPSATANTPTRTTYCAFTGIPLFLAVRPHERQPVSFLSGLLNRGIAVSVRS